ncbi:MAG: LapA family protein [Thermodesulfobacterium sp.]|nr:LapA family protein [Thermodesulfobacterium sp.]
MVIRLIIWIIITLSVVFFVVFNVEPKVQVHLLPGVTLENIPLALVIIISFILGLLAGMILFLGQIIKYQLELRKVKKEKLTETKKDISGGSYEDQS